MSKIRLRPAKTADLPTIRAIIKEGQINPFGVRWENFIVAVLDSKAIVGVGQLKPLRGGIIELASIAVRPAYQGQGIARQIITHLLAQTTLPVWLMCATRLTAFYQQFGFAVADNLPKMPTYYRRIMRITAIVGYFSEANLTIMVKWK